MNGIFTYLFNIENFLLFVLFQFFNNAPTTKCHYYFLTLYTNIFEMHYTVGNGELLMVFLEFLFPKVLISN